MGKEASTRHNDGLYGHFERIYQEENPKHDQ